MKVLLEVLASGQRENIRFGTISVDKQTFGQLLLHLSGILVYAPGTNDNFNFSQKEFRIATAYGYVNIQEAKEDEND